MNKTKENYKLKEVIKKYSKLIFNPIIWGQVKNMIDALKVMPTLSTGALEYTDYTSAEG